MLRTKTPVQNPQTLSQDQLQAPALACGLRAIDPADFKFIGGGAPRGGWLDAEVGENGVILSEDAE